MGTEPESACYDQNFGTVIPPTALKILVAEDNLTNQKVILRQLQSLGYTADLVADGQAAVDATAHTFYQIILMDCCLPQLDGYRATGLIRQREQTQSSLQSIIIALTASDDPQTQHKALAAGMNDFLTKPLRRETLADALTKWSHWQHHCNQATLPTPQRYDLAADSSLALHLDLERLHQLSDHNEAFEQELLQLYLDDTQEQVQQLLQAGSRQNFSQIERTAHHIRGASASVGAIQLEKISEALEQQAQQQQPTIIDLIEQLNQAFVQIRTLLQAKLQQ